MVARFQLSAGSRDLEPAPSGLQVLIEMHHSYLPGRLLAWTETLKIALFCSVAREEGSPTIFVLDPLKLNILSHLPGIVRIGGPNHKSPYFSDWPKDSSISEFPIAVDGRTAHQEGPSSEAIFTVHGADTRPIEQQCPDCVRKVVLTELERAAAMEYILSGADVNAGYHAKA
jgi:hypothetical protein